MALPPELKDVLNRVRQKPDFDTLSDEDQDRVLRLIAMGRVDVILEGVKRRVVPVGLFGRFKLPHLAS